ncbi:hypothetical protein J7L18_03880 [Candidatus Bathyarchaeota archaeon]|nr:hypothetical protein [Candidatus Bathyarchaeota archaeon]
MLKARSGQRRASKKNVNITATLKVLFLSELLTFTASTLAQPQHKFYHPSVRFDKDFYMPGERVTIYGTITFDGKPVEGAKVIVNIEDFGISDLETTTDSNGNWTLSFQVPEDQKLGTYPVNIEITHKGNTVKISHIIRIGKSSETNMIKVLTARIAELNRKNMELKDENRRLQEENQRLKDKIKELQKEIQRLKEASGGASLETLGIIAIVLAVIVGISASILAYKTRKPPAK